MPNDIDRTRLLELLDRELGRFERDHPRSRELFERAKGSLLAGVPMPWMSEWAGPYPVFVAEAQGHFVPHDLTLGAESDGIVQVLAGLAEGDQVVTSGQFLLDAESRLREAIQKHLAEGLAPPPAGHEGHAR